MGINVWYGLHGLGPNSQHLAESELTPSESLHHDYVESPLAIRTENGFLSLDDFPAIRIVSIGRLISQKGHNVKRNGSDDIPKA